MADNRQSSVADESLASKDRVTGELSPMNGPERRTSMNSVTSALTQKERSGVPRFALPMDNTIDSQDRVLYYCEFDSGRRVRHKLNFGTPHTKEAAAQLGATFSDCIIKPKSSFIMPGVDPRVAQLRYEHHYMRVTTLLKSIYELRCDLLRRTKAKATAVSSNHDNQNGSELGQSKSKYIMKNSSGNWKGQTCTNLPEFCKEEKINPAEKTAIKNFIENRWKEIVMLEAEKRQELLKKERESEKRQTLESLKKPESSHGKTTFRLQSVSPLPSPKYTSLVTQPNKPSLPNSVNNSTMSPSVFVKSVRLDLDDQVKQRREAASIIGKRLEELEARKQKMLQRALSESCQVERTLDKINQKLVTAVDHSVSFQKMKIITANRTSQALEKVQDKVRIESAERMLKRERQYSEKALKIESTKRMKAFQLQQITEKRRKKSLERKQKQDEEYKRQLEGISKAQDDLQDELVLKSGRKKKLLSSMSMGDKELRKELLKLNQEMQQENTLRVNRVQEHKRKQIIESHIALNAKNCEKRKASQLYDCYIRKQAVNEHEMRATAYKLLGKLMKSDPYKSDQRQSLTKALRELNDKLDLKIPLKMPEPRIKKKQDDVESDTN